MEEAAVQIDWSAEVAKARAEARDAVSARGGRRAARTPGGDGQTAEQAPPVSPLGDELDRLYAPENMEAIVQILPEFMFATTGHPHWVLKDAEVKRLSVTAGATAKYFLTVDPKWVVLALFLTNATMIYGSRFLADLRIYNEERKTKEKEEHGKPARPTG